MFAVRVGAYFHSSILRYCILGAFWCPVLFKFCVSDTVTLDRMICLYVVDVVN